MWAKKDAPGPTFGVSPQAHSIEDYRTDERGLSKGWREGGTVSVWSVLGSRFGFAVLLLLSPLLGFIRQSKRNRSLHVLFPPPKTGRGSSVGVVQSSPPSGSAKPVMRRPIRMTALADDSSSRSFFLFRLRAMSGLPSTSVLMVPLGRGGGNSFVDGEGRFVISSFDAGNDRR